jgi:hypothetical protein
MHDEYGGYVFALYFTRCLCGSLVGGTDLLLSISPMVLTIYSVVIFGGIIQSVTKQAIRH